MSWWERILTGAGFTPSGFCLFWDPDLITLEIVGNLAVALAYFAIPAQLGIVALRGDMAIPRWILCLFTWFILFSGVSHVFNVVTLFQPYYWAQALEVALTGVISLLTAVLLPFEALRKRRRKSE
jgi:two-component system, NtrC family, sensor kinase